MSARGAHPRPVDDLRSPRRLAAVQQMGLLDTPPEEEFDRLTRVAAVAVDAPLAFVTIVDDRRSFWKICIGLDVSEISERQLPVEESLCHYGVSSGRKPDRRGHPPRPPNPGGDPGQVDGCSGLGEHSRA